MATEIQVLTPQEVAAMLKTSADVVLAELESGRLRGFRVGGEWRVLQEQLLSFASGKAGDVRPDVPGSITKEIKMDEVKWQKCDGFDFVWPDGKSKEHFDPAFGAEIAIPGGPRHVVVGYTTRWTAGIKDRARVVVFYGQPPSIVPIVEFAGANDYATSGRLASVIKNATGQHVRAVTELPPEYTKGFKTAIYRDLVDGPYAARSIAVVADKDDRSTMLRHAIIRAGYKGK